MSEEVDGSEPGAATERNGHDQLRYVDSHCHIHDERIPDGTDGAVAAAAEMGVDVLVTVGCDRATSLAAIEAARLAVTALTICFTSPVASTCKPFGQ